jgi:hypothetical protein
MPAFLLACAGLLSASLAAPTLDVGLLTEARLHAAGPLPGTLQPYAEGEVTPWIRGGLAWRQLEVVADYRPVLTLTDQGGGAALLLHRGSLLGRWQKDPGWLVSTQLTGALGDVSAFQLVQAAGAGGAAQLVPTLGAIGYRSLEGTLGLGASPSKRDRLMATVTAAEEGGATPQDQRWLPLQRRLRGRLGHEWEAGPHDVVATGLEVTAAEFSTGPRAGVAALQETWRRATSYSLRLWAGGGPALAGERIDGATDLRLRPAAEAGAEYDGRPGGLPVTGRVVLVAAPAIDQVTGAVPERAGLTGLLAVLPAPGWRLEATGSTGRVLEGVQRGDQAWALAGKVGRSLGDFVELAVGTRALLQRQPRFLLTTLDWQGFVSLEVHPRRPDRVTPDPAAVKDPLRPPAPGGAEVAP